MAKSANQKAKLIRLLIYLWENTDEDHAVSMPQILAHLESWDIKAERKSIYDDIAYLNDLGFEIQRQDGPRGGYYMVCRTFELAEVKLLVDLVQSAKFITPKKSRELIGKLERQVSHYEAVALHRQVTVADRNKTANEKIYYNVDRIYEAMAANLQVRFHYFEWDVDKKMQLRRGGAYYEVSPWLLTWDDENYYLRAFDEESGILKTYRVDKMLDIALSTEKRLGREAFEQEDVASYSKRVFGMFAGDEVTVRMRCDASLTGVLVDRFGQDVSMRPDENGQVLVRANVQISPQFYGWLASLGSRITIMSPKPVVDGYKAHVEEILKNYGDSF